MENWLLDNAVSVSALILAVVGLIVAVIYALTQLTQTIADLTNNMVKEVKTALSTSTGDRQTELAFLRQYLSDSTDTRQALIEAQSEVRSLASSLSEIRVQMGMRRDEADRALTALNEAREDAYTAQAEYEAERTQLSNKLASMVEKVDRLTARVSTLETQVTELEADKAYYKSMAEELQVSLRAKEQEVRRLSEQIKANINKERDTSD